MRTLAIALALLTSAAVAQTFETSTSVLFTCVDREGVKRLRNYPCGPDEVEITRLRLRTTTTTSAAGTAVARTSSHTLPQPPTAEEKRTAAQALKDRQDAQCGPAPKQPPLTDHAAVRRYTTVKGQHTACLLSTVTKP